eukprot:1872245-Prymnesium_polylepis.1
MTTDGARRQRAGRACSMRAEAAALAPPVPLAPSHACGSRSPAPLATHHPHTTRASPTHLARTFPAPRPHLARTRRPHITRTPPAPRPHTSPAPLART